MARARPASAVPRLPSCYASRMRSALQSVAHAAVILSVLPAALEASEEVFARIAPSVVSIATESSYGKQQAQGSGVVVGPNEVVTNCHVVDGAHEITVVQSADTLAGRTFRMAADLAASDTERDLCLLYVAELSRPPAGKPATLRPATELSVGEEVYAVGSPEGLSLTLSRGIVSQLRGGTDKQPAPLIQTDAAISPGSSGGGLFDSEGNLVGITTFKWRGESLNFALPVEWVSELRSQAEAATPSGNDRLRRESRRPTPAVDWHLYQQAVFEKNAHAVRSLLEAGTHPDSLGPDGRSVLSYAAEESPPDVVQALIEAGADPNSPGDLRPLAAALRNDSDVVHIPDVVHILLEAGADPNLRDRNGNAPLHMAVAHHHLTDRPLVGPDVVRLLLEAGADPNVRARRRDRHGETPLHDIADYCYYVTGAGQSAARSSVVRLLLGAGADPNLRDRDGDAPLHRLTSGHPRSRYSSYYFSDDPLEDSRDVVSRLLQDVARLLVDAGADPDVQAADGQTPLHRAVGADGSQMLEMLRFLLAAGADPNLQARDGKTPLHHAVRRNTDVEARPRVQLLLEGGADPNVRDHGGESPRDSAGRRVRKLLREAQ